MKTYRLYCVFSTSVVGTSKYLKNNYQILFSLLLVLPQFVLIAVWYVVFEVRIQVYRHLDAKTNTGQIIYWCGEMDTLIYPVVGYILLLTVVCGCMAFHARKLPENFSETLTIFYAMFTNIMLWLPIFMLCYNLGSSINKDKRIVVGIHNFLSFKKALLIVY